MADVDLYDVADNLRREPARNHEDQILHAWERDIVRAARFRARNRGHDEDTEDEFAQAARLRVWHALRKTVAVPGSHYLRKVIANTVRTPLASDRALAAASEIDESAAIDTCLQQSDHLAIDAVRSWINTLPAQLQRVYQLLFVEESTQHEAALVLGVSQPRVAQLHRALLERGSRDLRQLAA
jgi:RNA polymerase sigma factor (sigma-70 family)